MWQLHIRGSTSSFTGTFPKSAFVALTHEKSGVEAQTAKLTY